MLSIFSICVTDSSPVMTGKKWDSVRLVKVRKLRNAQSTYPVLNHAQDLYQSVIGTTAPSEISNFDPFPLTNVGFLPWM